MCLLLHQSSSSDLCLCLWPPSRSLPSSLCSTTSSRSDWTPRSSSQSCGGRWPCAPKTSVRCGGAGAPIKGNVAALQRPGYVGVEPPLVLDWLAAQCHFRIEPVRRSPGLSDQVAPQKTSLSSHSLGLFSVLSAGIWYNILSGMGKFSVIINVSVTPTGAFCIMATRWQFTQLTQTLYS